MFPSLLINIMWFSTSKLELKANLRSLMWSIGVKGYPLVWWQGQLLRFHRNNDLRQVFDIKELFAWLKQGREAAILLCASGQG